MFACTDVDRHVYICRMHPASRHVESRRPSSRARQHKQVLLVLASSTERTPRNWSGRRVGRLSGLWSLFSFYWDSCPPPAPLSYAFSLPCLDLPMVSWYVLSSGVSTAVVGLEMYPRRHAPRLGSRCPKSIHLYLALSTYLSEDLRLHVHMYMQSTDSTLPPVSAKPGRDEGGRKELAPTFFVSASSFSFHGVFDLGLCSAKSCKDVPFLPSLQRLLPASPLHSVHIHFLFSTVHWHIPNWVFFLPAPLG